MASFFKNLFRKEGESQPVPAGVSANDVPDGGRLPFQPMAESSPPAPTLAGQNPSGNGPFAAVSARHMTARELAALLPPALLRFDGVSPDQPVPLPVEQLRQSMLAGRPVMRLSRIQEACPLLFLRAPGPEEDVEVTLPMARVKGILESSGAVPPVAAGPPGNPFESLPPRHSAAAASPFAIATAPVAEPPSAPVQFPTGNPFAPAAVAAPAPAQPPAAPVPSPAPMPPAASAFSPVPPGQVLKPALPTPPLPSLPKAATAPAAAPATVNSPFAVVTAPQASAPSAFPMPPSAQLPTVRLPADLPPTGRTGPAAPPSWPLVPATGSVHPVISEPDAVPVSAPITLPQIPKAPPVAVAESAEPPATHMELSLRAVLRDADPVSLGFSPENVPEAVRVSLPVALVAGQLSTGRVEIGMDDLRQGVAAKFHPAFARAAEGLRIVVPMSEVFHHLPESSRPALEPSAPVPAHLSITTSPFQTPFAIKVDEDREKRVPELPHLGGMSGGPNELRPMTQPVPPPQTTPPALHSPAGLPGSPTTMPVMPVQVELPVLPVRVPQSESPAVSAAPAPLTPPGLPAFPMKGMLSRAPGSSSGPTPPVQPPRTAPRLKPAIPSAPVTLRPFPKPAPAALVADGSAADSAPMTGAPFARSSGPTIPPGPPFPSQAAGGPISFPPFSLAQVPAFPAAPEGQDDLGESISASQLTTEPPPRPGSAPVRLPSFPVDPPSVKSALLDLPQMPAAPAPLPSDARSFPAAAPLTSVTSLAPPPLDVEVPSLAEATGHSPVWPPVTAPAGEESEAPALAEPDLLRAAEPEEERPTLELPVFEEAKAESVAPVEEAPAGPAAAEAVEAPSEDLTFGCISDLRQLTLRAVLGSESVLSPQDIVNQCALLPGLKSCVLFRGEQAIVSEGMDDGETSAFRASAAKTRDSLQTLAETMGLGSGGNFTLRTDHGVRSFFLEAGLCLAVWHDQPAFSGGTREKLILIAREIGQETAAA